MRTQARLVIIGAGIVGTSAAYHLTKMGWRDIVVVDQGPLFHTGGSTSHAPGLVFQTNSSRMMTEFAKYTVELFGELEQDGESCIYPVGGVEVARSAARWEELKRKHGWAQSYDLDAHLITPAEVREMIPILDDKTILGGYYVPTDGDARAVAAAEAMARYAEQHGGAAFYGGTTVTDVEIQNGRVQAVVTDKGRIETEMVLVCTNIWSPALSEKIGLTIPLLAVEHQYVITEPLAELAGETREIVHPILRNQDYSMYFRQHKDAYGIGSYQHEPLLIDPRSLGKTAMNPFTPGHFEGAWRETNTLLPPTAGKEWVTKFNGMFAFTVDGYPIMGEAPHIGGLWVAVGVWVTHSGGVGRAIAEWMAEGAPTEDIHEADMSRFHPHAYSRSYIYARCAQQYREIYDIIHPKQQIENPRGLRLAPYHERLKALGGKFFEGSGWERPQWFACNEKLLEKYDVPVREGWAAEYWSPVEGAEHLAARESAALFDLTAFTKIKVSGPNALGYLNYMAANQIDQPVGKVVYTALLDQNGRIKADLTITRLDKDSFLVLTGGGVGPHDLDWVWRNTPLDGSVQVTDMTSQYATIGLWGPNARKILERVAEERISNEAFPYFTVKGLTIGSIPTFALRVSYAGELGWEIYTPTEYGLGLWDTLWEAGQDHGLIAAGGGAFDSLRLEKGYRLWGADIHTDYNPYEAGLGWAVRLNKGDFLGREALLKIKEQGISRKLCCLTLDEPGAVVMGKEPIFAGDTKLGFVTSANMGYSVGKFIAYGYLPVEYAEVGTKVQIEYFGERLAATVSADPQFDPKGERMKQ